MKQRSKVIATSIATIAMCASLAVGGTFALFTSESEVNIAVTSGTVDVKATATNLDKSNLYSQEAAIDGGMVSINNMIPGDSITFDVEIKNYSTVTANYRTILTSEDGGLADALTVSFEKSDDTTISFLGGYGVDNWKQIAAAQEGGEVVETITVTIAFNSQGNDIDNLYQGKDCAYKVYVEAVQGNAPMVDPITKDEEETERNSDTYYIWSEEGMRLMTGIADSQLASMPSEFYLNFKLMADLDMTGYTYYPTRRYFVNFDGNGHTIENLTAVHNPNDAAKRAGLFGYSVNVKNVTLKNVNVTGNQAALVVSSPEGNTISDVTIEGNNSVTWVDSGMGWMDGAIGAIVGVAYRTNMTDITVADGAKITLNYNGFVNQLDFADDELGGHFYVLGVPTVLTNITVGADAIVKDGEWYTYIADGFALAHPANGETYYAVSNANGLTYFAKSVNEDEKTYAGETVKLTADIDLENKAWTPIGKNGDEQGFKGTFDGQNKTISNLYVDLSATRAHQSAGLFGSANGGTLKNFTVSGATIKNLDVVGDATSSGSAVVLGASQYGETIENVKVYNATVESNRKVAAIVGYFKGTVTGCYAENVTLTATAGEGDPNGDKVGGIVAYINTSNDVDNIITNNTVTGAKLKAYRDIGGIVGGGYPDTVTGNKAENISIIVDQVTGNYGDKDANANYIVGRNLSSANLTDNTAEGNNSIAYTQAVSSQETLAEALGNTNDTVVDVVLSEGDYTMPEPTLQGKTLTITGTKDTAIDVSNVDTRDQFVIGASIVFDGVTLNFCDGSGWFYMGFANVTNLTYKNCHITGLQMLMAENVTFENCVIDSSANTGEPHSIWTYGAKNVNFIGCEFIYGNRALNLYNDQDIDGGKQVVKFDKCTFTTTATDSKGAVEINSSAFSVGIEVYMTECNAPANGDMVYVSEWDSTGGEKTTVYVNGSAYNTPVHTNQTA